jgi:RodZ C-terminal domain
MRRWGSSIVFALLLMAGLALAVFGALIASGHYVSEPGTGASPTPPPTTTSRPAPPPPTKRVVPEPRPATNSTPSTTVVITIKASRGDCWVNAHRGSPSGKQLAFETLRQGKTITLRGPRIWLQLGAADNVDITVNGRARPVPAATTGFVLG